MALQVSWQVMILKARRELGGRVASISIGIASYFRSREGANSLVRGGEGGLPSQTGWNVDLSNMLLARRFRYIDPSAIRRKLVSLKIRFTLK